MTRIERAGAAAVLAAALAAAAAAPRRVPPRAVLAAVDAEAFSALAGRRPDAADAPWERLKAMGVSAAVLREETLADVAARGEVLHFSRAEVEKWRAAGLVSPSSGLKGGTLWAKDPKALSRAADALAARGVDVASTSVGGGKTLELPSGADLSRVSAGFNPASVAALASAGILPVAPANDSLASVAGQMLRTRTLPVDARPGEILRAAASRPLRLIVFRPRPALGLEGNVELLRASLRVLRSSGAPQTLPVLRPAAEESPSRRRARWALVWLIGAVAPLLAVRAALQADRAARSRVCAWAPVASPVPQVLASLIAAWAVSSFAGLVVAGVAPDGWRDGTARLWTLWTLCAPLAVGAATLFSSSKPSRRSWSEPVRRRDLAAALFLIAAATLLLAPRAALRVSSFWESFDRVSAAGALWWWPWRWREALVGVPCLTAAFALIESRDESAARGERAKAGLLDDPRSWLLLGLLGPAGVTAAVGGSGVPLFDAVAQGLAAWGIGVAVALLLSGFRLASRRF